MNFRPDGSGPKYPSLDKDWKSTLMHAFSHLITSVKILNETFNCFSVIARLDHYMEYLTANNEPCSESL